MITLFIFITMGLFQSDNKTEIQKYEVIQTSGEFEIRYYPSSIMATVEMGGTYDSSRNSSFGTLARYIFGGNEEKMQISMTAPVRVSEAEQTMSFVMPSRYSSAQLPKPEDDRVRLHSTDPAYAAVVRFGGWASDRKIQQMKERLSAWIAAQGMKHNSRFEYLGYNPPFQLTNRRNELLVPLIYEQEKNP